MVAAPVRFNRLGADSLLLGKFSRAAGGNRRQAAAQKQQPDPAEAINLGLNPAHPAYLSRGRRLHGRAHERGHVGQVDALGPVPLREGLRGRVSVAAGVHACMCLWVRVRV